MRFEQNEKRKQEAKIFILAKCHHSTLITQINAVCLFCSQTAAAMVYYILLCENFCHRRGATFTTLRMHGIKMYTMFL